MESLIGRHRIYDGFKQYKMETTIKSCSFLCSFHSNYNYNRFGVVHSFNSILARNFSSLFAYAFVSSSIFSALHSSEQVTNKRTKWTSLLFMCIAHCDAGQPSRHTSQFISWKWIWHHHYYYYGFAVEEAFTLHCVRAHLLCAITRFVSAFYELVITLETAFDDKIAMTLPFSPSSLPQNRFGSMLSS